MLLTPLRPVPKDWYPALKGCRVLGLACGGGQKDAPPPARPDDGSVLPFPKPPMGGSVGVTMQQSVHKWREEPRRLPADAPNIVIVMFDDAGFGHPSAFGGAPGDGPAQAHSHPSRPWCPGCCG